MLERIYDFLGSPRSGEGLAFFRITFCLTVMFEVLQMFYFRHVIWDPTPYVEVAEFSYGSMVVVWLIALFMMTIGWHFRLAAIAHYILSIIVISGFSQLEYHVDYAIVGVSFCFLFFPMAERWSIDALRRTGPPAPVPYGYYFALVYVGVGIVYFDSVFHKLGSDLWMKGLGFWKPSSVLFAAWTDMTPLLNIEWLMRLSGYVVLVFEALFIFLLPFRRLVLPLVVIGQILHGGIIATYPIPLFGLVVFWLFFILYPDAFHRRLASWFGAPATAAARALIAFEDGVRDRLQQPVHVGTPLPYGSRGALQGLVGLILISSIFQGFAITKSKPVRNAVTLVAGKGAYKALRRVSSIPVQVSSAFMGITAHPVFMDYHFEGVDHIVTLAHVGPDGTRTYLPMYRDSGQPGPWVSGRFWVYYHFRVTTPVFKEANFSAGARRLSALWLHQRGMPLDGQRFDVMVKSFDIPDDWEHNFLRKQMAKPWRKGGVVRWDDKNFTWEFDDIERF